MLEDLKDFLKKSEFTARSLQIFKNNLARKDEKNAPRRNSDILKIYRDFVLEAKIKPNSEFEKLLRIHKIRTSSGVSIVAVLTKPYPCPGKCTFCPTEKGMPKSYLSNEPAVMRAVRNNFSPKYQTAFRLMSLENTGHKTDKVEMIVMGGTFSYLPKNYRTNFIRGVFSALNQKDLSLDEAKNFNETAKHRCVGLTLETRPDFINEKEIKYFRRLGCTRVEIGVQSFDDEILKKTKRGHLVEQSKIATKLLKDAGLKVAYHLMPGLPGSNVKKDIEMVKQCFDDPDFRPDLLKIYPCVITKNCELYLDVKNGEFTPLNEKETEKILIESKKFIPEYTRLNRVIRDIPSTSIEYGSKVTNLRQRISEKANCRCIRCREIRGGELIPKNIILKKQGYEASGGKEFFLTFEEKEKDKLISILRLRFPSQIFTGEKHFISELENASIIRELHTFGVEAGIGKNKENAQHRGFGKKLILEAEKITKNHGIKKIAVISGVGVRSYYRKLGFRKEGEYMVKKLK